MALFNMKLIIEINIKLEFKVFFPMYSLTPNSKILKNGRKY